MAINFNGETKIISLSTGTTSLSIHDLYSRWKDWVLTSNNSKYARAFSVVGGDPIDIDSGTSVPLYAFLENGWKIRPYEGSHTLNVSDGILLVQGGGDPFVNTLGSYIVRINYQQPVQAIGFNTGGSGSTITVDDILDEDLTSHNVPNSTADVLKKTKQGTDDNAAFILSK